MHAMSCRRTAGFSLVEVLVALLVLSVGALGVANLQMVGIYANGAGNQRAQATLLANDLVDRIRANRAGALAGEYDIAANVATPADPGCLGAAANCTPAQQADADLATWRATLANVLTLATGAAAVANPAGPTPSVTVTVTWLAAGTGGTRAANANDSSSVLTVTAGL
ncbi:MAG: type IV pilus modification protein PilV [Gammaproteobacteria bacterium]